MLQTLPSDSADYCSPNFFLLRLIKMTDRSHPVKKRVSYAASSWVLHSWIAALYVCLPAWWQQWLCSQLDACWPWTGVNSTRTSRATQPSNSSARQTCCERSSLEVLTTNPLSYALHPQASPLSSALIAESCSMEAQLFLT